MLKKSRRKAERIVKRKLADGSIKEYRYGAYKPKQRYAGDSLNALIRAYTRSPSWVALNSRTKQTYLIYLRPLEEIGHLLVKQIRRRDIHLISDAIAGARGNGAALGFRRVASSLFGWAVRRDWIEHSPVHHLDKLPRGHLPAWTQDQADAALVGLPEHLRRVVVLALHTGQRRGDLCAMTWSAYDGAMIRVRQQKTGEELEIPAHPELQRELAVWRREAVTILTNTLGRPWTAQHLSHELPTALARIGLPAGLNVHGLRKLAAARLAEAGCSANEIAAVTGHQTLAMVQLYTRSADQRRLAGAAVVRLEKHQKTRKALD